MARNEADFDSYNSMELSEEEVSGTDKERNGWEQVGRGGRLRKRKKQDEVSLRGTESEEREDGGKSPKVGSLNVVVRFEGEGGVKKIDPLKLTKIIRAQVGEVKYARVLGDGNLLIGCNTENQVERARKLQNVGKVKVIRMVRVGEQSRNGTKGVITGVPLSVGMRELVENLKVRNNSVKDAKRMTRGTEKKETETVLVEFDAKDIPKELYFGFIKYNVREFVPKPMRCFNCQEFGHIAKMCKGKRRCARCGDDHEYGKCGTGVKPKCCNCGGEHSVAYWGCEAMKREAAAQQIRVKEKVPYSEAIKMAGQGKLTDRQRWDREQMGASVVQELERKLLEEKKEMVTFMAGVINATADVKSKTERIQIIVKAAVHHLGLRGIKWEEIRDKLSIQASQDAQCIG